MCVSHNFSVAVCVPAAFFCCEGRFNYLKERADSSLDIQKMVQKGQSNTLATPAVDCFVYFPSPRYRVIYTIKIHSN